MSTPLAADATSARRMHSGPSCSPQGAFTADAPTPRPGHDGRPGMLLSPSARAFLVRYARTLAVLLVSTAVLLLGWSKVSTTEWVSSHPWLAAVATTTGWALAVAPWLRRRGWSARTVHALTWAAPTALLLPLVWIGWVLPGEIILWGPVTSMFGVACAMAADPVEDRVEQEQRPVGVEERQHPRDHHVVGT
jgi:hypothetical protein